MSNIQFAVPAGETSSDDRLQHIAVQAAAVMLQPWFEKNAPTTEQAKSMVESVIKALMGRSPPPF